MPDFSSLIRFWSGSWGLFQLRHGHGRHFRRTGPQPLRHAAQVLRGGGQQKLITGAGEPAEPETIHFQDALHVRKQHLYHFALSSCASVLAGPGNRARHITSRFKL